jgi:hypothetical protein
LKGNPGGPGRPPGSRTSANRALDRLAAEGAEAVLQKQIELAQAGDQRAAEIVLKRAWAQPRGRLVEFELPPITTVADVVTAMDAVAAAVGRGDLTPEEGACVAEILEKQRRALELVTLEETLRGLEAELLRNPLRRLAP